MGPTKTEIELQREYVDDVIRSVEGIENVYFQPPASITLKYPCILYEFSGQDIHYADNKRMFNWTDYSLTLVDKNPESILHKKILDLGDAENSCHIKFDRFFIADNLNHWSYSLTCTKNTW